MNIWGIVDTLQQQKLIAKQRDLLRNQCIVLLKPHQAAQFGNLQGIENVPKNCAVVPLVEATIVVDRAHLLQIIAQIRELPEIDFGESSDCNLRITSCWETVSVQNHSIVICNVDQLGGYVQCRKRRNRNDDARRYVCLQEIRFSLKAHELQSLISFLYYISDSLASYDFPYGACTFEYIYWSQALKECRFPAFNVVVTVPDG